MKVISIRLKNIYRFSLRYTYLSQLIEYVKTFIMSHDREDKIAYQGKKNKR